MMKETKRQIEESYNHIKPYLSDSYECGRELREMCNRCERYCGKKHDFAECRDMPCFRFYLAYKYLEWLNSSDGY